MKSETENKIAQSMKKYKESDFKLYLDETGWEEWMYDYISGEELSSSDIDKIEKNRDTKESMATINIFKCRKCNETKCTTYQLQIASADEPMTTFICCKVCGYTWKK